MNEPKHILVIDDDPDILEAIQFTLESSDYNVTASETADIAENLHKSHDPLPDLIILDVLLSGKDGRIICKKLKSKKETKHIPIVMISAHPSAAKSVEQVGANAFLPKPFDIQDLLTTVASHIPPNK